MGPEEKYVTCPDEDDPGWKRCRKCGQKFYFSDKKPVDALRHEQRCDE